MPEDLNCQDRRCQARKKPYKATYFIRSDYCNRKFVCGYHARAWVKSVREPLVTFSERG